MTQQPWETHDIRACELRRDSIIDLDAGSSGDALDYRYFVACSLILNASPVNMGPSGQFPS